MQLTHPYWVCNGAALGDKVKSGMENPRFDGYHFLSQVHQSLTAHFLDVALDVAPLGNGAHKL